MVTATDIYTLLFRDIATEEVASLCAISVDDLERICSELQRSGVATPGDGGRWRPGPAAEEDVLAFQRQVYGLIDLDRRDAVH